MSSITFYKSSAEEKLFLLHEEFQKPIKKIRVDRLSRHLYDVTKLYNSQYKDKAYDIELIDAIIKHRERFNGVKGVNYADLYPPNLNSIPPDELITVWENDYKTMCAEMIPDESPSFDEVLKTVKKACKEYNGLKLI